MQMRRSSPRLLQRDPARAFFLCLLVLAQLLLPSAFARAQAMQPDACVSLSTSDDNGKSSTHDHTQQCAHCRPQAVTLASPIAHPQIAIAAIFEVEAQHADQAISEAAVQTLPPPTGPPAAATTV